MDQTTSKPHRMAVTGHRFIPGDQRLDDALRRVFSGVVEAQSGYGVYLYSALAEGADQLAARVAQEFVSISLVVPLPLPEETYLASFSSNAGRQGFTDLLPSSDAVIRLPEPGGNQTAYQALGTYLVEKCDALIAIWNGQFNHRKGGTGEVVKMALAAGKPVHWIYCPNFKRGALDDPANPKEIGTIELLIPPDC